MTHIQYNSPLVSLAERRPSNVKTKPVETPHRGEGQRERQWALNGYVVKHRAICA